MTDGARGEARVDRSDRAPCRLSEADSSGRLSSRVNADARRGHPLSLCMDSASGRLGLAPGEVWWTLLKEGTHAFGGVLGALGECRDERLGP
jgi:hypothetical protein